MFIVNYYKTAIINIAHIYSIHIEGPKFERPDWVVSTLYKGGTTILHKGTQEECEHFLCAFYNQHS